MSTRSAAAVLALIALTSTTWAAESAMPASEHAKQQLKQKSAVAKSIDKPVKKKSNPQFEALEQATQSESRKVDTLSNASKTRHDAAKNAVPNQR